MVQHFKCSKNARAPGVQSKFSKKNTLVDQKAAKKLRAAKRSVLMQKKGTI